ncbi:hypothetical protein AAC387_Pa01g1993 [Persea americana]
MVVKRNDKKKKHYQRRITQQWEVKEDDPETAMVCMTGGRRDRRSARLTAQSSNPIDETLVTDENVLLIKKNTEGMDSPILRVIDDDVSLTTRSLENSFSPNTGPCKYPVFMAGEISALVNAEEQFEGENPVENIQDLVKQRNDKISQIATQLQFLMERMTGPNDHPLVETPSSSNRKDQHTSGMRINQITVQMQ